VHTALRKLSQISSPTGAPQGAKEEEI